MLQILIFFIQSATAQNFYPPVYPDLPPVNPNRHLVRSDQVNQFRVLIFPHLGQYPIPQGAEVNAKMATIETSGTCRAYLAVLNSNQEWQKSGELLHESSKFQISLSDLGSGNQVTRPIYYECHAPFTVVRPSPLASLPYSGDVVATSDGKNVELINLVDPETYIKGVVPAEVGSTWPDETLKAQAIAARSYAWWNVLQNRSVPSDFDMDDTVFYQAYLGNEKRTQATDLATDETSGLVMKYGNDIIKAYFSADSGGYTESSLAAFGVDFPYCQPKQETYDLSQVQSDWTRAWSVAYFQEQMVSFGLLPSGVAVKDVSVSANDRTQSGRVAKLTVLGRNGHQYSINGNDFRQKARLRSSLFKVSFSGNGVVLNGKGYGHGVGMAQIGALQYTKELNWTAEQILQFYYTGITISHE